MYCKLTELKERKGVVMCLPLCHVVLHPLCFWKITHYVLTTSNIIQNKLTFDVNTSKLNINGFRQFNAFAKYQPLYHQHNFLLCGNTMLPAGAGVLLQPPKFSIIRVL